MATWEREFELGGYEWEVSAVVRRWPNWGLGVLVHRTRFSLIAVWLMLGPFEAWLDVQIPMSCSFIYSYTEDNYLDEEETL
jgi:hypothetical protein